YVACLVTPLQEDYIESSANPPREWCDKNRTLTDEQKHVQTSFDKSKIVVFAFISIILFLALCHQCLDRQCGRFYGRCCSTYWDQDRVKDCVRCCSTYWDQDLVNNCIRCCSRSCGCLDGFCGGCYEEYQASSSWVLKKLPGASREWYMGWDRFFSMDVECYIAALINGMSASSQRLETIRKAAVADSNLQTVWNYIHTGQPAYIRDVPAVIKDFFSILNELLEHGGIITRGNNPTMLPDVHCASCFVFVPVTKYASVPVTANVNIPLSSMLSVPVPVNVSVPVPAVVFVLSPCRFFSPVSSLPFSHLSSLPFSHSSSLLSRLPFSCSSSLTSRPMFMPQSSLLSVHLSVPCSSLLSVLLFSHWYSLLPVPQSRVLSRLLSLLFPSSSPRMKTVRCVVKRTTGRLAVCSVCDGTTVYLITLKGEQIDELQEGETYIIKDATVEEDHPYFRIILGSGTTVSRTAPLQIDENLIRLATESINPSSERTALDDPGLYLKQGYITLSGKVVSPTS
ncbi:hypothetical protein NFI96_019088, partial [Prochilodus magdalenae]